MTDNLNESAINVYTDGSSYSRPRRGGIGMVFVIIGDDGHPVNYEHSPPGYRSATNNQMELQACIEALDYLASRYSEIDVSDYPKIIIKPK